MNLSGGLQQFDSRLEALLLRMRALGIDPALIDEQFVRGSGPGGQKINKTSNCVLLRYPPLELVVRCQETRQRSMNRFLALRELVDQAEMKLSPGTSLRLREIERRRKSKGRAHRRAVARRREATPPSLP